MTRKPHHQADYDRADKRVRNCITFAKSIYDADNNSDKLRKSTIVIRRTGVKFDYHNLDKIPRMQETLMKDYINKYNTLLAQHNLNPDDYEPAIDFDFMNNKYIVIIGVKPVKRIQGVSIKNIKFES